jgi:hypothetical protein
MKRKFSKKPRKELPAYPLVSLLNIYIYMIPPYRGSLLIPKFPVKIW